VGLVMNLYIDDSGTRDPDRRPARANHGYDWFSLGGVLIKQEEEHIPRAVHAEFMARWEIDPDIVFLHSAEIRGKTDSFTWLAGLSAERRADFLEDLYRLMTSPPLLGFACIIDRPGYKHRYYEKYGRQPWSMCRTAFSVVVERAAKYASDRGYKLRVFVERADRVVDEWVKGYYEHLKANGMPFNPVTMEKYTPLTAEQLNTTLYEFRTKSKSSPLMQLADLYLWPMSIGGYHRGNQTYARLLADGMLIDCRLEIEMVPILGIKYSCFDLVTVRG
jgi:hypothetical protein